MRIITVYPHVSYESFNEPGDNPLARARTIVAHTDDEYVRMLADELRRKIQDVADGDGAFLAPIPNEPIEPVVKISEVNTSGLAAIDAMREEYAGALAAHREALARREPIEAFMAGAHDHLTPDDVDSYLLSYQDQCEDGYPPQIYVTVAPDPATPAAPPMPSPAGMPFTYELHDDAQADERVPHIMAQLGSSVAHMGEEEFSELIGRPFYTVTLNCAIDLATGAITIVSAS